MEDELINDVADGLEDRMATINGLQVSGEWQDTPNPPAAIALLQSATQSAFAVRYTLTMRILVIVSTSGGIGRAERNLTPYMTPSGNRSIFAAINGDTTLGGAAEGVDTSAATWEAVGFHDLNGVIYWGSHLNNLAIYVKEG